MSGQRARLVKHDLANDRGTFCSCLGVMKKKST